MPYEQPARQGAHCVIGQDVTFGKNVTLGHGCVIEDGVTLGDGVFIDSHTIVRSGVTLGAGSQVGAGCILGEHLMDFYQDHACHDHPLVIGPGALLRSGTILYGGSTIGAGLQTGHRVTIREGTVIGDHVSIGTLSDIQGNCHIGNYVRLHSNVHVGQLSRIDDFVWIYPYVVLTNDPTPPSEQFAGVHVHSFAIVATGALVMPGLEIGQDALVAAGAVVTKPVPAYAVVVGSPGRVSSDVRRIKNKFTGEPVYPWRHHFKTYMPWAESDFTAWYNALDLPQKRHYGLEQIEPE